MTETERRVFFATFLCTAIATALLIAPSAQHRILWRAHDKEALLKRANALALAGTVFLAAAVTGAVWVVTDLIYDQAPTAVVTAGVAGLFAWIWFVCAADPPRPGLAARAVLARTGDLRPSSE